LASASACSNAAHDARYVASTADEVVVFDEVEVVVFAEVEEVVVRESAAL
jgi:ABC-type dipeptide/oligopeptide/nickel transport system ATPase component